MNLFYSTAIDDSSIILSDQEAQHCSKVLRQSVGDKIHIMDGRGHSFECIITKIGRNEVITDIEQRTTHEPQHFPHLAFGLIKNTTRMEWLLEKVTEIGVSSITPLITARSERRQLKLERLEKVILSAAKQSLKYHLPALKPAIPYKEYINSLQAERSYIASYNPSHKNLWEYTPRSQSEVILIGPEGDFTTEEVIAAQEKGAIGVNLGKSRLRAETAAIVACTHLNT